MANEFTKEQKQAIETLDKSVLVSAAAGSGKTSVLIERIIRIILEGKANVDEMLVVTFTNAAASEMKLRLAGAIRKRMADHPEDVPRMKDQLARLYKAYISTIDSFALRVIKEFFHMTDMEPSFGVADDVQCELLRREALSELFEDGFENDGLIEGGSFRAFLRLYSEERSDDTFMDGMLEAYSKLRTMPDYFEWAFDKAEQLKVTPDTFEGSEFQRMMFADAEVVFRNMKAAFAEIRKMFAEAGIPEMYEAKLSAQENAAVNICDMLSCGAAGIDVISAIEAFPSTRLAAAKSQKEAFEGIKSDVDALRKPLKKEIDDFKKRYMIPDLDTRLSEMNSTYEYTVYYLRMLEEFERRYDAKKREKRVIDFADMEHIAVCILKNDEAADTLRRRFRFIFVDEYQDTNNIQESLISRVARPDNVFRVGDVKQSIYKFRQAEPEIFERLYARYIGGMEPEGIAIDLGRNFRTNDATIRYINHVFSSIMEGYDERAMLYTGIRDCPPEYDFIPEVHVLYGESAEEEYDADDAEAGGADEEIEELSKEEAEAEYIAGLVQKIIGTEFYDTKAGVVRKAGARDIAILFRAVKRRGEIMSRALRERAIDAHVEETEDFFDTIEIEVALALLTCIDNMKRDVQLIAVLHSEVFGFSPDELARVRIEYKEKGKDRSAYWEAFKWFAEEGPEGRLKEKAAAAVDALMEWRRLSRILPLEDFVWKVLVDSGYYRMAGAMPGGASRQANLRALADRAGRFSKDTIATLSSFITFLDLLKSKKIKNGQASMVGRDDDVVRISTIHKSKGLEYPFVIVGGLGHRFRYDTNSKGFSFDPEGGVGLPYVDPARRYWRSTVLQRAINSKSKHDSYREEMRLLYVAMTRARNKLYMVGTVKDADELYKYQLHPANFLKAMQNVLRSGFNRLYVSPLVLTKKTDDAGAESRISAYFDRPLNEEEQAIYEEIDRRFSYRYPDEDLLTEKAKYSVSAIRKEELEKERQKKEAVVTSDDEVTHLRTGVEQSKRASAADVGIAYHRIMEFLDFSKAVDPSGNINKDYIAERAAFLREHDAIDADVYDALDLSRIDAFFTCDLGRRAAAAALRGSLMREKPFTLRTVRSGRDILVQGVIDCCFEEDGKMILIDYKSSFIRPDRQHDAELERIRDEYKVQIELYKEAVEKGTGMEVTEAYLYLFAAADAVMM